jgi:streptomycin 6-kinase
MPRNLLEAAAREGRTAWLAGLPDLVAQVAARWSIEVGSPFQPGGETAWVAPARTEDGAPVVLKIMWPHPEGLHEADGLAAWRGEGTVLLHAADRRDGAIVLLLERCMPGTALSGRPETEHDQVITGLLPRLWIEPSERHPFRPLAQMCEQWADEFEAKLAHCRSAIDPGLARAGIALFRQLPATANRHVLLVTDLHAGNVLAADREPWLVIDPKPYLGDPTYDALQHMLNCGRRLHADPLAFTVRMADLLELDADRLRLWLFARCVQESLDRPELADVATRISPA